MPYCVASTPLNIGDILDECGVTTHDGRLAFLARGFTQRDVEALRQPIGLAPRKLEPGEAFEAVTMGIAESSGRVRWIMRIGPEAE